MFQVGKITNKHEDEKKESAFSRKYGSTLLALICAVFLPTICSADVVRLRGVSLAHVSLYQPREGDKWTCLDNSRTIKFTQINDDYCDCNDGSDEPGTSACSQGSFYCQNSGFRALEIPSSRVNDGICDCCDGSDEYSTDKCQDVCQEMGRVELEKRKTVAELHKRGAAKRTEMILKGKQLRADREARRRELEARRNEVEALKAEKEALKKTAEAAEAEALEIYKEQQRETEAATGESTMADSEPFSQRIEAEATFARYDVNKDGFVELTELQIDMILDRDRNGVVTVEEAKYFLDDRDRMDLDAFATLAWPRIKTMQMLAEGLFKPPQEAEEEAAQEPPKAPVLEAPNNHVEDRDTELNDEEGEEENQYEEDEDADIGVGSVREDSTPPPQEYDPETQRIIELANEARSAYSQVENEVREIDHEIKEIDDQNAKDYGPNDEYAAMDGECYNFEDREYVYSLCPFDRASQKPRSGGSETTLGRWDQWVGEGDKKYSHQKYSHGASCWNGPQRSATIHLQCGMDHRITAVSEPNRCEYFYEFETPAACDEIDINGNMDLHDEL